MAKKVEVKLVCEIDGVQYNMITSDYTDKIRELVQNEPWMQITQDEILEAVWGKYHEGNLF